MSYQFKIEHSVPMFDILSTDAPSPLKHASLMTLPSPTASPTLSHVSLSSAQSPDSASMFDDELSVAINDNDYAFMTIDHHHHRTITDFPAHFPPAAEPSFAVEEDDYFVQEPRLDFLNFDNESFNTDLVYDHEPVNTINIAYDNENDIHSDDGSHDDCDSEEPMQAVATVPQSEIVTAIITAPPHVNLRRTLLHPLPPPDTGFDYGAFRVDPSSVRALASLSASANASVSDSASVNDSVSASSPTLSATASSRSPSCAPLLQGAAGRRGSEDVDDNASMVTVRSNNSAHSSSPDASDCSVAESAAALVTEKLQSMLPAKKPGRKRKARTSDTTDPSTSMDTNNSSAVKAETSDAATNSATDSDSTPLSDPVLESKRLNRLHRNRASAQLSRERKKAYMTELENQLKELSDVNSTLEQQMTELAKENEALKMKLELSAPADTSTDSEPRSVDVIVTNPSGSINKRAKLSTSKRIFTSHPSVFHPTATARTTLLMVSIILTMAFFCSMVSMDGLTDTNSATGNTVSDNRKFAAFPLLQRSSRVLSSIDDSDVRVKTEKLAIEPPPSLTSDDSDSRALVPVEDRPVTIKTEPHTHTHADSQANDSVYDPRRQYRIENVSHGNSSDSSVSDRPILLCPQSFVIQPTVNGKRSSSDDSDSDNDSESDSGRTAKRLRRTLGLPSPTQSQSPSFGPQMQSQSQASAISTTVNPDGHDSKSSIPRLSLSTNDELLLWVSAGDVDLRMSGANSSSGDLHSGLVQVTCQISSIQPVQHANN